MKALRALCHYAPPPSPSLGRFWPALFKLAHYPIPLALDETTGIRDLTPLPDGRLLILAGPAQEQKAPYSLFTLDPRDEKSLEKIGTLKKKSGENEDAKAEAITLLGPDRVLILFDSILNGGPREYTLVSPLF